jgi:integrase
LQKWHLGAILKSAMKNRKKAFALEPKHVPEKKYSPWMVAIPEQITLTRRVRKYFKTREEAVAFCARVAMDGWRGAEQRSNAQASGAPRAGASGGMRVAELCALWADRQTGKSAAYVRQVRYVAGSLVAELGAMRVAAVDHHALERWLLARPAGDTRWNHYRLARRIWNFAIDWLEVIERNPFRKISAPEHGRAGGATVAVLSPADFAQCLALADKMQEPSRSRWIAYLALGGLAGLRTEEIFSVLWEDVGEEEIFVRQPKRVRGWHPRYVKVLPRFAEVWAQVVRPEAKGREGGKFAVSAEKVLPGGQRELYTIRRAAMDALGWTRWPTNCLRHSYGTYHLARFKNLAELRGEMGHESEGVTRRHYATAARGVDAEKWWGEG